MSLQDTLKVTLSNSYEVSDSDLKVLSDTFFKCGLDTYVENTNFLLLFLVMYSHGMDFPVKTEELQQEWEQSGYYMNLSDTVSPLIHDSVLFLTKKDGSPALGATEMVLDAYSVFCDVLTNGTLDYGVLSSEYSEKETFSVIPKEYEIIPEKIYGNLLDELKSVEIESYLRDSDTEIDTISLVMVPEDKISLTQKEVEKVFKKYLKNVNLLEYEVIVDSDSVCCIMQIYKDAYLDTIDIASDISLAMQDILAGEEE